MPYTPHLRLVLSGQILSTEIWSTSVALRANPADITDEELELMTAAAITPVQTLVTALAPVLSTSVNVTAIKLAAIGADGKEQRAEAAAVSFAGTGTATRAPQDCVVASLRTGRIGRSKRGRMYLPLLAVNLSTTLRISSASQTSIANAVASFLGNLATDLSAINPATIPCIASSVTGLNTLITEVLVGDRIDTQRRRRDALPETYIGAFPVYP